MEMCAGVRFRLRCVLTSTLKTLCSKVLKKKGFDINFSECESFLADLQNAIPIYNRAIFENFRRKLETYYTDDLTLHIVQQNLNFPCKFNAIKYLNKRSPFDITADHISLCLEKALRVLFALNKKFYPSRDVLQYYIQYEIPSWSVQPETFLERYNFILSHLNRKLAKALEVLHDLIKDIFFLLDDLYPDLSFDEQFRAFMKPERQFERPPEAINEVL